MAEGTMAVLKYKVLNPTHRGIENWKMYAIKQIKICAEYRDTIPYKGSAGLSAHLGFGLSASAQVPDKPALALGTMSRYSAQILICII